MKVLEERCDVITNMEVMLLLVQQQQLLPSVDSLLRHASKQSTTGPGAAGPRGSSASGSGNGGHSEDPACGQTDSVTERFRLEHLKELLYQHMFYQMVQDYIRKTCPYLRLVRAPFDSRHPVEKARSQPAARPYGKRLPGGTTGSRRICGLSVARQGGASPFISRRCRECLDVLFHRFSLTDLEMLMILNFGAFKPVEIYMFLEDCSNRFTEDDAATMLNLLNVALVQQQALPPLPEVAGAALMEVDMSAGAKTVTVSSEVQTLQQQQQELLEEARQLALQQERVQREAPSWANADSQPGSSEREDELPTQQATTVTNVLVEDSSAANTSALPPGGEKFAEQDVQPIDLPKELKPRKKIVHTASAKRRVSSRRKRVLD